MGVFGHLADERIQPESITPSIQCSTPPVYGLLMQSDDLPKKVEVFAYAGYKANERPLAFVLDGRRLEVRDILDRWYGVDHDYFRVLADNGTVYLLRWNRPLDIWCLVKIYEKTGWH